MKRKENLVFIFKRLLNVGSFTLSCGLTRLTNTCLCRSQNRVLLIHLNTYYKLYLTVPNEVVPTLVGPAGTLFKKGHYMGKLKFLLMVLPLFVALSSQALAQSAPGRFAYSITNPPPPTWFPYNTSTSFTNKKLPADVLQHCSGNTSNCADGDMRAKYALSNNGQDTDLGNNPSYEGGVMFGMAADRGSHKPIYYGQATDPWYRIRNCEYDDQYKGVGLVDVRIHAPNKATWSGSTNGDHSIAIFDVAQGILIFMYHYIDGSQWYLPDGSSCPGTGSASCAVDVSGDFCGAQRAGIDSDLPTKNYDGKVPGDTSKTHYKWAAPSGFTYIMGGPGTWTTILREKELMHGTVNHAIAIGAYCTNGTTNFPIMDGLHSCAGLDGQNVTKAAPAGALLFLDYTPAQIASMLKAGQLTVPQATLLTTMSTYGGYFSVTGGDSWSGMELGTEGTEGGGAYAYYFPNETEAQRDPIVSWGCAHGMNGDNESTCQNGVVTGPFDPNEYMLGGIPRQTGPGGKDLLGNSCSVSPGCYVSGHIHMADECVAKALAGVSGGCP